MRLILASASPRRAELLSAAGFAFAVHVVHVDERPLPDEPPPAYVSRVAMEKATQALDEIITRVRGGASESGDREIVILAADTAVVVDGTILGKPRDTEDAARMLRLLSGRPHEVLTGVNARSVALDLSFVESTTVMFSPLLEDQIAWYVASGEGADKAGGYAIQGLASRFIPRIEGSYSNVVGLPIAGVEALMRRFGVLASEG